MSETFEAGSQPGALLNPPRTSLVQRLASRYQVDATKLLGTLKATAFRQKDGDAEVTDEQMMALLIIADKHKLDPFTGELFAFRGKGGAIVPIVSVDGWARIINEHPAFDGMEFEAVFEGSPNVAKVVSTTCTIFRKDRSKPMKVTEYLRECRRSTPPWESHPARMLRHKSMIQCARLAFSFAGIFDEDEGHRIIEGQATTVGQVAALEDFNAEVAKMKIDPIVKTAEDIDAGKAPAEVSPSTAEASTPAAAAAATIGPTVASILHDVNAAKTVDELNQAADLARSLTDERERAEVDVAAKAKRKRLP